MDWQLSKNDIKTIRKLIKLLDKRIETNKPTRTAVCKNKDRCSLCYEK